MRSKASGWRREPASRRSAHRRPKVRIRSYLFILVVALVGCKSIEKKKAAISAKPVLSAQAKAEIDEHIEHLNNQNIRERWRNSLVELAKTELETKYITDRLSRAYTRSRRTRRAGLDTLTSGGRARAVFVLGKLGIDDTEIRSLLLEALEDSSPLVRVVAAEAFAEADDPTVFPALVKASTKLNKDTADRFVIALKRFAKPQFRKDFLKSLRFPNLTKLSPLVDQTLESGQENRILREIVTKSDNPAACAYAVSRLEERKAAGARGSLISLLRRFTSIELRRFVFRALVTLASDEAGVTAAAALFEAELQKDPGDASVLASSLRQLGSSDAVERLGRIATNSSRTDKTRAMALRVLGDLRSQTSPKDGDLDTLVTIALGQIRRCLKAEGATKRSAIRALGKIGDRISDADRLIEMTDSRELSEKFGEEIVEALTRLGGLAAFSRLVLLLKRSELRESVRRQLAKQSPKNLPLYDLVKLLSDSSVETRAAADSVLRKTTGAKINYDPNASPEARKKGRQGWLSEVRRLSGS